MKIFLKYLLELINTIEINNSATNIALLPMPSECRHRQQCSR